MDEASAQYRVRKCSKCLGDREYYCVTCECDLCLQCKENHVKDLNTIDHFVVVYLFPKQEVCVKHPDKMYEKYCTTCELPVCYHCRKHRTHRQLNVISAYSMHRQQLRETIHTLRSEALFCRPVILSGIKADFKTCRSKFFRYESEMLKKAQTIIKNINSILRGNLKHRCLKQRGIMNGHISSIQVLEHMHEQSATSALQFLLFTKTTCLSQIHLICHTTNLISMNESPKRKDAFKLLSQFKITDKGKRHVGNECLLKIMSSPKLYQSISVIGFDKLNHISCASSDKVWVSDISKTPILTNKSGRALHYSRDSNRLMKGAHTVNSDNEFIYIDKYYNINKLSKSLKTTTIVMQTPNCEWKSRCVYWSPWTRNLLVGVYNDKKGACKVTRFNQNGQFKK